MFTAKIGYNSYVRSITNSARNTSSWACLIWCLLDRGAGGVSDASRFDRAGLFPVRGYPHPDHEPHPPAAGHRPRHRQRSIHTDAQEDTALLVPIRKNYDMLWQTSSLPLTIYKCKVIPNYINIYFLILFSCSHYSNKITGRELAIATKGIL